MKNVYAFAAVSLLALAEISFSLFKGADNTLEEEEQHSYQRQLGNSYVRGRRARSFNSLSNLVFSRCQGPWEKGQGQGALCQAAGGLPVVPYVVLPSEFDPPCGTFFCCDKDSIHVPAIAQNCREAPDDPEESNDGGPCGCSVIVEGVVLFGTPGLAVGVELGGMGENALAYCCDDPAAPGPP